MSKVILLTGFNNWGKTTHLYDLFGLNYFRADRTYPIPGVNADFSVESHSNDDYSQDEYINTLDHKINLSPNHGENLFATFCPTREPENDSRRILNSPPLSHFDEIHLFYLKFKWDHHAELLIENIRNYFAAIHNIHQFIIDADEQFQDDGDRFAARRTQIRERLGQIYP